MRTPNAFAMTRGWSSALLALATLALSACGSIGPKRSAAPADVEEGVSGFTIVETERVPHSLRADYEAAIALLARGNHAAAIPALEAVIEKAPELAVPRIDLGIAHHQAGDLEAAEAQLVQALALHPKHPVALNELGIVYRRTGRFEDARRSYEAALDVYPSYHYALRNLAVLCDLYLGDLACALDNYEAYAAVAPGDESAAMWIAGLRLRMGQEAN